MEPSEQTVTEEAQALPENAEQHAAVAIQLAINEARAALANYKGSKRQLQRVMDYLLVHPLEDGPLHFSYPHEKELFDLSVKVMSNKLILLHMGLKEQERKKAQETNGTNQALHQANSSDGAITEVQTS